MAEYISREAVMQKFADHVKRSNNSDFAPAPTWNQAVQIVEDSPAANVVPVGAYNQAAWERDTAIEQLKQIGKSFGEKMDDVRPVVLCKDCRHRDPEDHKCDCGGTERQGCPFKVADDYFCAYGER